MKRVLALQFIWDDPPGYLGEIMEEHQIVCDVIKVEEEAVPDPAEYDALIAMGGPQHVGHNDTYPYLVGVTAAIRRAVEKEVPYLGLCLGGQLLASAMGAQVKKHTDASIGFYEIQFTAEGKKDPLFKGLPGYQQVIHWHEDTFDIQIVRALGEEAADKFISDRARLYLFYREHTRIMFENFLRIAGLLD